MNDDARSELEQLRALLASGRRPPIGEATAWGEALEI
jgi:hypothetical protein